MPSTAARICFVTGTRAEFGLMRTTLQAIAAHPALKLQIVVTGMHLDPRHGRTLVGWAYSPTGSRGTPPTRALRKIDDFSIDALVPWPPASRRTPVANAANTGRAIADLARAFDKLKSDIVLVVGDRVEAFAAAAAAHLSHRVVAHIHGGDRALGQIDDSLRHAITKLAHIHLPATPASAQRIAKLGEENWRIHCVGSPGNDRIAELAASAEKIRDAFPGLNPRRYALLLLHPIEPDEKHERRRAELVLKAVQRVPFDRILVVYPNNDPGCGGIIRAWTRHARGDRFILRCDLPREVFLGLLRDAAALVGNSSAGIIEAAAFGTAVLDIGPRQLGRERSANVAHCDYDAAAIRRHLLRIWHSRLHRQEIRGSYNRSGAGRRIARILATTARDDKLLRKLIVY